MWPCPAADISRTARARVPSQPGLKLRKAPNEASKVDDDAESNAGYNDVVKVKAIVTGSGVEYLQLADKSGYYPFVCVWCMLRHDSRPDS